MLTVKNAISRRYLVNRAMTSSTLSNVESEDLKYSRREMDDTKIITRKVVDREREWYCITPCKSRHHGGLLGIQTFSKGLG